MFFCAEIFTSAEPHLPAKDSIRLRYPTPHLVSLHTQRMMTVSVPPEAALSPLPKADGSATYSYAGYAITASANGPIEAQRRDEHPYEALVDVVVRPASGVGGEASLCDLWTGLSRKQSLICSHSHRNPGAASRSIVAAVTATAHSRQELSALPHPDRFANHSHSRQ